MIQGKPYSTISKENDIDPKRLSSWWEEGHKVQETIRRSNKIFNAKKDRSGFEEFSTLGKLEFFKWYEKQPKVCAYCGIEEEKLKRIFDKENGILHTKRSRGRVLELERIDAKSNEYSPKNCVLVCYLCNNHKSDLITKSDHEKYFTENIYKYLNDKYDELGKAKL